MKTLPFASQEMHVGFAEGRMRMTGPIMSDGASAVTQLLSSSTVAAMFETVSALEELSAASRSSPHGALRFLDFLSPLKDNGLTMVRIVYSGDNTRAFFSLLRIYFLISKLNGTLHGPSLA